jgi:outer membrane lipase/esterase
MSKFGRVFLTRQKAVFAPLAVVMVAAIVAACGGGSDSGSTPKVSITAVKVMGDSLADSGTFGFKFTVQDATNPKGFAIWPERIAATYGITSLCSAFQSSTGTTFTGPNAGCTNYAMGGGRINNPASNGGAAAPYSIPLQIQVAGAGGNFGANDLVLIDGGGNDSADLIGVYLAAAKDGGASLVALTSTLVPAATVQATLGQPNGAAQLGGIYMTALADKFFDAINAGVLAKGATRVVVLNMPGVTNTPRFGLVLGSIAAASGGGAAGQQAATAAKGLFDTWAKTFNDRLASKVAGNAAVALVDFSTAFTDQVTNPAQYGLTNVTTPACPITGVGTDGLPSYTFPTCTSAALDASTPTWKTYGFSDGFHPTPVGHQLLAQLISVELAKKGWL